MPLHLLWTHPRRYTVTRLIDLSRAWRLNCGHACASRRVDEAVSGGKPPAGKGVVGMLSWHGSHFWVCITICRVRHGDSVTKPDYYYYYYYWVARNSFPADTTCMLSRILTLNPAHPTLHDLCLTSFHSKTLCFHPFFPLPQLFQ